MMKSGILDDFVCTNLVGFAPFFLSRLGQAEQEDRKRKLAAAAAAASPAVAPASGDEAAGVVEVGKDGTFDVGSASASAPTKVNGYFRYRLSPSLVVMVVHVEFARWRQRPRSLWCIRPYRSLCEAGRRGEGVVQAESNFGQHTVCLQKWTTKGRT